MWRHLRALGFWSAGLWHPFENPLVLQAVTHTTPLFLWWINPPIIDFFSIAEGKASYFLFLILFYLFLDSNFEFQNFNNIFTTWVLKSWFNKFYFFCLQHHNHPLHLCLHSALHLCPHSIFFTLSFFFTLLFYNCIYTCALVPLNIVIQ